MARTLASCRVDQGLSHLSCSCWWSLWDSGASSWASLSWKNLRFCRFQAMYLRLAYQVCGKSRWSNSTRFSLRKALFWLPAPQICTQRTKCQQELHTRWTLEGALATGTTRLPHPSCRVWLESKKLVLTRNLQVLPIRWPIHSTECLLASNHDAWSAMNGRLWCLWVSGTYRTWS